MKTVLQVSTAVVLSVVAALIAAGCSSSDAGRTRQTSAGCGCTAGAIVASGGNPDRTRILCQPQSQTVKMDEIAKFSVTAERQGHKKHGQSTITYQWYFNNTNDEQTGWQAVVHDGKKPELKVTANLESAGRYRVEVDGRVMSEIVDLAVYTESMTKAPIITLYGLPIASSGNSSPATCPGSYAGYYTYKKTVAQGWGWKPTTGASPHKAKNGGNRPDSETRVEYVRYDGNKNCDTGNVTVPDASPQQAHRFTIYFTGSVPTTNYPIVLEHFDP
jgi:hypothetical protein